MDPSWEFQAPQFVDFNNLERSEDKKADDFFNVDMESGELWTTALCSMEEDTDQSKLQENAEEVNVTKPIQPSNAVTAKEPVHNEQTMSASSSHGSALAPLLSKSRKPANLVTSWGKGSVTKVSLSKGGGTSAASSSSAKQPAKKRRRLSSAIVQSLASSSGNNNTGKGAKLLKMTPRRHQAKPSSITGYKFGASPKRLGTNSTEPRLAINLWKKKASILEEGGRPSSAPASSASSASSKFFATVPKPFKLSTETRAVERKQLDHRRREEESLKEKLRQKELSRMRKENEAELLRYRQTLVHRAQPINQFRKIEIKRSDKMLTMPESPQLTMSSKTRSKLCSI